MNHAQRHGLVGTVAAVVVTFAVAAGYHLLSSGPIGVLGWCSAPVTAVALSADGNSAGVGTQDGEVLVWADLRKSSAPSRFSKKEGPICSLSLGGNGAGRLLAVSTPKAVYLLSVENLAPRAQCPGSLGVLSADGRLLLTAHPRVVSIWAPPMNQVVRELGPTSEFITALAISRSGDRAACGVQDGTVIVWELASNRMVTMGGHDGNVVAIQFVRDDILITADAVGQVFEWTVDARMQKYTSTRLCGPRTVIGGMAVTECGTVFVCQAEHALHMFSGQGYWQKQRWPIKHRRIAVDDAGGTIVFGNYDGRHGIVPVLELLPGARTGGGRDRGYSDSPRER